MRTPKVGLGYFAQTINTQSLFQGFTAGLQIPLFGGVNTAKAKGFGNQYFAVAIGFGQKQADAEFAKTGIAKQFREAAKSNGLFSKRRIAVCRSDY